MRSPCDQPGTGDAAVAVDLRLQVGTHGLQARLAAPAAPVKPQAVLPALQALVDVVVDASLRVLQGEGRQASCATGCAACCRQLVPVSAMEAYHLSDLVASLPEPRRGIVMARFADISRRVKEAGLYEVLMAPAGLSGEGRQDLAFAYYALKLDCPFLDEETCSIYAERPLICREYMVTSPASKCAAPQDGGIEPVPVPRLSRSVLGLGMADDRPATWPPLTLALDWAATHPDDLPLQPGAAWIKNVVDRLAAAQTADPARET